MFLLQVMKYCGGGDLDSYYKKAEFTHAEFVRVMLNVLSGVAHLHERGIAHRDLKPANVLLETGTNNAMLADFGLAKTNRQTVTRGVGTPAFMPPEMFSDEEVPEKTNMLAVDIYALGIILWQLWFKQAPFADKGVHVIIAHVMIGKRLSLTGAAKGSGKTGADSPLPPKALSDLIQACWHHEAGKRPTINEVYAKFKDEVAPAIQALDKDIGASAPAIQALAADGDPGNKAATALRDFLGQLGLEKHKAKLAALGITDVETLSDREICDDATMLKKVGMSKLEVRKLRTAIEVQGTGPTMMKKQAQAASVAKQGPEVDKSALESAVGTAI